ncbi:hypothetical protein [Streptomyces albidus (ex Kaewkla and Franco 2022)]|uniref:hypothetical protein n=1 Tax=Streptomyces albidus (ex Kaewkla and Franco 2022) TaxID=722709 RepID=UPI0015EF6DB7|nr:hypothetical protein [Streptomyces albidus (ex Kaewkla and Franco 2022)]
MTSVESTAGKAPEDISRVTWRTKVFTAAAAVAVGVPAVLLGYGEYVAAIGTLLGAAGGISVTVVNIRR